MRQSLGWGGGHNLVLVMLSLPAFRKAPIITHWYHLQTRVTEPTRLTFHPFYNRSTIYILYNIYAFDSRPNESQGRHTKYQLPTPTISLDFFKYIDTTTSVLPVVSINTLPMESKSPLDFLEWLFIDKDEFRNLNYDLLLDQENKQLDVSPIPSQGEDSLLGYVDPPMYLQPSFPKQNPNSTLNSNSGASAKQKCGSENKSRIISSRMNEKDNNNKRSKDHNILMKAVTEKASSPIKSKKRSSNDDVPKKIRVFKKAKFSTSPKSTPRFKNLGSNVVEERFLRSVKPGSKIIKKGSCVDQPLSRDTVMANKSNSSNKYLHRTRKNSSRSALSSSTATIDLNLKFRRDSKKNPLTEEERRLKIAIRTEKNRESARRSVQKKKERELRMAHEYDRMRTNLQSLVQDKNEIIENSFGVLKNLVVHFLAQNSINMKIAPDHEITQEPNSLMGRKNPTQWQATSDSFHESADSFHESADSFHESADSFHESADSFHEPADSFHEPADSFHEPADSFHESADSFHESADSFHESSAFHDHAVDTKLKFHGNEVTVSAPEQYPPRLQVDIVREPLDHLRQDAQLDGLQVTENSIAIVQDQAKLDLLLCAEIIDSALFRGESGKDNQPESEPEEEHFSDPWAIFEEDVTVNVESPFFEDLTEAPMEEGKPCRNNQLEMPLDNLTCY